MSFILWILCAATFFLGPAAAWPEDQLEKLLGAGEKADVETLLETSSEAAARSDLPLIRVSHLSELEEWQGVRPVATKDRDPKTNYTWAVVAEPGYDNLKSFCSRERLTVTPLSGAPIRTSITPPETGTYRVWLCYLAVPGRPHPLKLMLGPHILVFNETPLSGAESGSQQEKERPIRFEAEHERVGLPSQPTFIWEYRDVTLAAERLDVALEAAPGPVRVDALFLTRSRDFRPSKAVTRHANTLGRTYLRFRVVDGPAPGRFQFEDNLTYHWRHFIYGESTPRWYWHLEGEIGGSSIWGDGGGKPVPRGAWSRWKDAGGALLSAGAYVTDVISCPGAKDVSLIEAQIAWFPNEAAVLKTVQIPVAAGQNRGTYLVPLYHPAVPLPKGWGMRPSEWLARFRAAADLDRERLAVVEQLGLSEGPLPYKLLLTTGCSPDPASADATATMLRRMGFSHANLPKAVLAKLGMRQEHFTYHGALMFEAKTHCPTDPLLGRNFARLFRGVAEEAVRTGWLAEDVTLAKFGDEIGAIRPPEHVNRCSDCRARFHAYLESHWGGPEFFGERNWDYVDYTPFRTGDGLYERRLSYASSRFQSDLTAEFYRTATLEITNSLPRCRTYCNFSPHPALLGGSMNESEWFNLTRRGGTSLAWGEDWASNFGWGYWMGMQIVSYEAAWVECAARGTGRGGGFYAVGGSARQQFSCVAHGLDTIMLYSYGPEYATTEASNAWSEDRGRYADIAGGLHALGAADTIIAEGRREPAAVGLFYNRDHEFWSPATAKLMQTDRVGVFVALEHAGLPVAIVLDEDLAAPKQPYRAIYLNGFNLSAEAMNSLSNYVNAGGVVVASAGVGTRDRFNGVPEALFGIRVTVVGTSEGGQMPNDVEKHKPIGTVTLDAAGGEKLVWPVVGLRAELRPIEGVEVETLGRFEDGSPAVVRRQLGKGSVIVFGVTPGVIYRARAPRDAVGPDAPYTAYRPEDAAFIAAPARAAVGRRDHRFSLPLVETRRFDHASGTAITLNNFYYHSVTNGELEVRWPSDRPLAEVRAALGGPLKWTRDGDWVRMPVALPGSVEVVVMR